MATQKDIAQNMISQLRLLDPSISADVGTPERMIIDTVARAMSEAQVDLNVLQGSFDFEAKVGTDLDNLLAMFGFGRQQGTRATGYVTFSRNDAANVDITIRKGTQLRAPAASYDGHDVIFYTSASGVLLQNTTEVVIPVECSVAGTVGNVSANTIVEAYNSPVLGITEINNDYATKGGTDLESDQEVKARFKATGPFRNLSGTESQYLATAIATLAKKAIVVGPVSKQREYFQIPLKPDNDGTGNSSTVDQYTTALSANNNAKYVYDNGYYVINETTYPSTHYREDFDFIFNSNVGSSTSKNKGDAYREFTSGVYGALDPTSSDADGKPNFTFLNIWTSASTDKPDTAIAPGDVILTEHSYLSSASRNDYENGILNCVDVYVNNNNYLPGTVTIPRPGLGVPTFLFTIDSTDAFYIENFRRLNEPEHRPVAGNIFTPLYHQPSADVPNSIEISDTTFYKNIHYWAIEDITAIGKTVRARNGIEWSSTIKGQKTDLDNVGGPYTGQLALAGNIFASSTNVKGKISKTGSTEPIGVSAFTEGQSTFDLTVTESSGVSAPLSGMYISGTGIGPQTVIDTVGTPVTGVSWNNLGYVTKYPITIKLASDATTYGWSAKVSSASASGTTYTYVTTTAHKFNIGETITITGSDTAAYNVTDAAITGVSYDGLSFTVTGGTSNPGTPVFTNGIATITTPSAGDCVTYTLSNDGLLTGTYYAKNTFTTSTSTRNAPPAYKVTGVTATGTTPNITYTFALELINGRSATGLAAGQTIIVSGTTGGSFDGTFTIATVTTSGFTVTGQTTKPADQSSLSAVAVDSRNWANANKTIGTGNVSNIYSFGYPINKNASYIYVPSTYDWPSSGTVVVDAEKINYSEATFETIDVNNASYDTVKLNNLARGEAGTIVSSHPIGSTVTLFDSSVDTYFTIDGYIYDNNIQVLQGALEGVKQISTDVLAHQATVRFFKPDITIMLNPGTTQSVIKTAIRSALLNHFEGQYFGNIVQLSDILQVIHNTPGVDNVKWSRDALNSWISGKTYPANSYVLDNEVAYYTQYGISTNKNTAPSVSAPMSYTVASASASGTTYTYTLTLPSGVTNHSLSIGDWVTISGSNIDNYNGNFQITAKSNSTFDVTGSTADPGIPAFNNSGLVVNVNWVVTDSRNKLTETNSSGVPIIEAILDCIKIGGDGISKTKYNFYFGGSSANDMQPTSGKVRITITKVLSDGSVDTKYADIDVGNIAFQTSATAACAYIKSEINGASPDLIQSVESSSDQKIPDSLHQFVITFTDSNRTETLSASNLSLVGNFGAYNYDFDLRDNELITLPDGVVDSVTGSLMLDSVMTVRIKSQSTWNVA